MKHGCLIVNLGSPDEPTVSGIRTFLSRMLSDRFIVDLHPLLWKPILNGIILRVRPKKLIDRYESIWTPDGSPLAQITRRQCEKLQDALPEAEVRYAFCYSSPSVPEVLEDWDINDLTVIPLYPHIAASSVFPVYQQVLDYYADRPEQHPHVLVTPTYATEPHMIAWYQEEIKKRIAANPVDEVLLSFHGVPNRKSHLAEHYKSQCHATRDAIAAGIPGVTISVSFQSKFGPMEWTQPVTADVIAAMPKRGVKRLLVATPAFVADCLETLEEIRVENRDRFIENGGKQYDVLSPINDDHAFIDTLVNVYRAVSGVTPR